MHRFRKYRFKNLHHRMIFFFFIALAVSACSDAGTDVDSDSAGEDFLENWGEYETAGGALRVCIQSNECQDGDLVGVTVNASSYQQQVTSQISCRDFILPSGPGTIRLFAVNGSATSGSCSSSEFNSGKILIGNYVYCDPGTVNCDGRISGSAVRPGVFKVQNWKIRENAETSSSIDILRR